MDRFSAEPYVLVDEAVTHLLRLNVYMCGGSTSITLAQIKDLLKTTPSLAPAQQQQWLKVAPQLYSELNNDPTPVLSESQKQALRGDFLRVVKLFEQDRSHGRSSTLTYYFYLLMLCQRRGYTDFDRFRHSLKGGRRLTQQYSTWHPVSKALPAPT
jgi:hypothetical protein